MNSEDDYKEEYQVLSSEVMYLKRGGGFNKTIHRIKK